MKKIHFLICFIMCIANLHAQDVLIDRNGKRIDCKITKEDSLNVYFDYYFRDKSVSTFAPKSDFQSIQYDTLVNKDIYSDVIVFQENDLGYLYSVKNKRLNQEELTKVLRSNSVASYKYNESETVRTLARILSCAGGALIGYPIGTYMAGKEPMWILAGIGAGLVFGSFPIYYASGQLEKKAVEIYNQKFQKTASVKKELRLGMQNNGIGLSLNF